MTFDDIETTNIDDGITVVNERAYLTDAKGNLVPKENVKAQDILEDETVRKIVAFADALNAQIGRFRGHTFTDLGEFDALLQQDYGQARGGKKGNRTYLTFDGCMKVTVQVADFIDFGPQLQVAKQLIDECLNEWTEDSRSEIRAIITKAFSTDKEGQVNRSEIFMLMRLEIEDERWQRAMQALKDAMRVVGSKQYVRFYKRDRCDAPWRAITIDLAKAS